MVPGILLLQVAFTTGAVLLLSAANMFLRDVHYFVQVFLVLAMFATSVVYPVEVPDPTATRILALNPMSSFLDAYREAILLGRWPWERLVPGIVGAAIVLVAGWAYFRRSARRFAEEA